MDINEMVDKEKAELRESLRLDAERYRKLKAFHKSTDRAKWDDLWNSYSCLDSAVDTLPEPGQKGGK